MRHGKKLNHLGRKEGHRKALMRNLASAIIEHKRINTTLAKAKALRVYLEPLVTKARKGSSHDRRVVFSYLQNKYAVTELFGPIAEKVGDRPGGYLRIIKTGFRRSDAAEMAMIEFVDFNDVYTPGKAQGGGRRRRRRGGAGKGAATAATAAAATTAATASEEEE
ncbi:MAG: 50S ribosomal protein L17 [Mameliella sp.]|nr:50S ribosomal protein L17 [Phaeodactylibacter sp.]NRA47688.1 50S ribosomal protein L17 [Phaeodactylibacter sp.]